MTLDREDIEAIAAQVAQLLAPMLAGTAISLTTPSPVLGEDVPNALTDYELVLMMSQPDPLKAIRDREKRLREAQPRKGSRNRRAA